MKKYPIDTTSCIMWQTVAQLLKSHFHDTFHYQELGKGVFNAVCKSGWEYKFKVDFITGNTIMVHLKSPDDVVFDFNNFKVEDIKEDEWETHGVITDLVDLCSEAVKMNATFDNDTLAAMREYL